MYMHLHNGLAMVGRPNVSSGNRFCMRCRWPVHVNSSGGWHRTRAKGCCDCPCCFVRCSCAFFLVLAEWLISIGQYSCCLRQIRNSSVPKHKLHYFNVKVKFHLTLFALENKFVDICNIKLDLLNPSRNIF